jgi:hypothetical protein
MKHKSLLLFSLITCLTACSIVSGPKQYLVGLDSADRIVNNSFYYSDLKEFYLFVYLDDLSGFNRNEVTLTKRLIAIANNLFHEVNACENGFIVDLTSRNLYEGGRVSYRLSCN